MSTLVELITALVFGVFGISEEIPPENNINTVVIECCDMQIKPSQTEISLNHNTKKDHSVILNLNQKSIKIEQNRTVKHTL